MLPKSTSYQEIFTFYSVKKYFKLCPLAIFLPEVWLIYWSMKGRCIEMRQKDRKRKIEREGTARPEKQITLGKKKKRRWCKKKKPAVSKTKESAAGVVHEQLVPKTESRTKWVLFGLEPGQSWAGLAGRERRQNQKRPTGRSLYNREGKPHRHNRDALDSLMIWLGLNLCQRGRQGDVKKKERHL